MTFQTQENMERIKRWFVALDAAMQIDNGWKHLDSAIEFERFAAGLLNLFYNWNLIDTNFGGQSQDSFDLADHEDRLAVQTTVTMTPKKIRDTLQTFLQNHRSDFDRLIFFYPWVKTSKSRVTYEAEANGFAFDPAEDRFGMDRLLKEFPALQLDRQKKILEYLDDNLAPLSPPASQGIDKTITTLIAVIEHMSNNAPADQIELQDLTPDQELKIQRLGEAARARMEDVVDLSEASVPLKEARNAVGIDTSRATKISSWLKVESRASLRIHQDDVDSAYNALVQKLLDAAHSSGTNAERTAVQLLLSQEMINCNVFPNPKPTS